MLINMSDILFANAMFINTLFINRDVFMHGEKLFLSVGASMSCYLYVFSITSDDLVHVLVPSQYSDNYISGGERLNIPPSDRFTIRVELPKGKETDTEMIKVIALKKEYKGLEFLTGKDTFSRFKLMKTLVDIPLSDITEHDLTYSIVRKK